MSEAPKPTEKQAAWLRRLLNGPAKREKSNVGYKCMQAGWTEWNYRVLGEPISIDEAKEKFGQYWFNIVENDWTERITELGRRTLAGQEGDER